jgi:lipopolysaccharide transport system permease protein
MNSTKSMDSAESVAKEEQLWDLEIKPKRNLFDIDFVELWRYKDLIWLFVRRDFVAQYKQTILGPVWHLIQPLLTTFMFLFLFGKVARIATDGIEPILFYMSGITIWNYFSTCLTATAATFTTNASIFGKVYFPRLILPLSVVISNIIRFGIQFLLLFVTMIIFTRFNSPIQWSFNWLLIPLLIFAMAGMSLGLGIIISSLTTKYRDLSLLLGFVIQLAMYATPIAYPYSFIKGKSYEWLLNLNPLTSITEAFRFCIFGRGTVTTAGLVYSAVFMVVVLFAGILIFNRVEKDFMDTV